MSEFEWKEGMGEISGFGGSYEEACRQMVISGSGWLDDNPDADPDFRETEGVFGLVKEANSDAERCVKAMVDAIEFDDEPTGAMVHACVQQVLYIHENGWDDYVEARMEGD